MNRDAEIEKELQFHIDQQVDEYVRRGMSRETALRRARLEFGGLQQVREECHDVRALSWWDDLRRDLRFAVRGYRRSPVFTVVAVMTLALGIGANTAIFSIVDGAILHPIPFSEPDRLVALYSTTKYGNASVSYLNVLDWQRQNHSFEQLAAWCTNTFTWTGPARPENLVGVMVSSNLFATLRIEPLVGRAFRADEDQRGASPVAMLGEDFWVRRFGRDSSIVGRRLTLNGRDYTVIGIVPSKVRLDRDGGTSSFANDVFVPLGLWDDPIFLERGASTGTLGLARLRPGIDIEQAQADMNVIAARLAATYPDSLRGMGVKVVSLRDDLVGNVRRVLWVLLGAVAFVLLIACANIANLVLARSSLRTQEFTIRISLGAERGRLMRQLLTENLILGVGGAALGVVLAVWFTRFVIHLRPTILPAMSQVELNGSVLIFAALISVVATLLFGFGPARHASRRDIEPGLRARGRGVTERSDAQRRLVIGQIALTLVLLVGCGLMIRSLANLLTASLGFDPHGVMMVRTGLSTQHRSNPDVMRTSLAALNEQVSTIPGVDAASINVGTLPFVGNSQMGFWSGDAAQPATAADLRMANYSAVGPDHFRVLRIALLRGRAFTQRDDSQHPLVVIVDRDLASTVFGTLDVIGQHIHIGLDRTLEIVGVVDHVAQRSLDVVAARGVRSQLYVPYAQLPDSMTALFGGEVTVLVRSALRPSDLFTSMRAAVTDFDPNEATHDERTMNDEIARSPSLDQRRFSLVVLGLFATTALLLSTIGIYGVISFAVTRRLREIGIRFALGASRKSIMGAVLGEGMRLAASGAVCGAAASLFLVRVMQTLLFRVSATDPMTFGAMTVVILLVNLLAIYMPARRASRIDPALLLRIE